MTNPVQLRRISDPTGQGVLVCRVGDTTQRYLRLAWHGGSEIPLIQPFEIVQGLDDDTKEKFALATCPYCRSVCQHSIPAKPGPADAWPRAVMCDCAGESPGFTEQDRDLLALQRALRERFNGKYLVEKPSSI